MTEYSSFTLNMNYGHKSNPAQPAFRGQIKVPSLEDGAMPTVFQVDAFGPRTAKDGTREFYDLVLTNKDPIAATRQYENIEASNKPDKFELSRVHTGRVFVRTAAEIAKAKADGKDLPKLSGHALVVLGDDKTATYLDLPAWQRPGQPGQPDWFSGNANRHDPMAAAVSVAEASFVGEDQQRASRPTRGKRAANPSTLDL